LASLSSSRWRPRWRSSQPPAVGLNIALGHGGLVSFGHAAFFGIGGYAAGILASHAQNYEPLMTWPVTIEGTQQMLIIWPVAIAAGGIAALVIGALSLRTSGVYFIMITLAFAQMVSISPSRGRPMAARTACRSMCATHSPA
jgi:ABC-type branched-subunit amino acid transport system permease subunit